MFKLQDNAATRINGYKLATSKGRLKIRGRRSDHEQGDVLEEPAAEGSGGDPVWGLVIAFQEELHHIIACDTRGLDLTTEKIISIPESL